MDAETIDILSSLAPTWRGPARLAKYVGMGEVGNAAKIDPFGHACIQRFLSKYTNPAFGWEIATEFAARELPFPLPMIGRDIWVFKAYMMQRNPTKFFCPHIAEAHALSKTAGSLENLQGQLRSLLMCYSGRRGADTHANGDPEVVNDLIKFRPPSEIEYILQLARKLQMNPLVIEAYEALFFNILDRKHEATYIGRIVYPDTRMVELGERYSATEPIQNILMRVAYNHLDVDMVSYISGLGDSSYFNKLAASDDRENELTKCIMGNGLMLTYANMINQRSVGMSRVSSLLAASRQSGGGMELPAVAGVGSLFDDAYQRAINVQTDIRKDQLLLDAGELTVDV